MLKERFQWKMMKFNKHRNIHLWGAPGIRHYLVDAKAPKAEYATTSFDKRGELV